MKTSQLILTPLKLAVESLKKALAQPEDEFTRDASIQRFGYTFELSWKMIKRYLSLEAGINEFNLKNLFREAGKIGLIDHVESWFLYHQARNQTSHTYNEKTANETYRIAQQFAVSAEKLLSNLEIACGRSS